MAYSTSNLHRVGDLETGCCRPARLDDHRSRRPGLVCSLTFQPGCNIVADNVSHGHHDPARIPDNESATTTTSTGAITWPGPITLTVNEDFPMDGGVNARTAPHRARRLGLQGPCLMPAPRLPSP